IICDELVACLVIYVLTFFFFSSRRRHTRSLRDWSSDVCSSDLDAGNSLMVIEHHLEVIRTADWILDLGPEAGDRGGKVVGAGSRSEERRVGKECRTRGWEQH